MNTSLVAFRDMDDTYYADTCDALQKAVNDGDTTMSAMAREHYPGNRLNADGVPGLMSVGYWDASTPQNWGLDWHRNEGIEITYLARGTLGFAVEDQTCRLQPNEMTITRPWQQHRVGLPNVEPSRLHWIILDVQVRRPNQKWLWPDWIDLTASDLERLTRLMQLNEQPVWTANRQIHVLFEELSRCTHESEKSTIYSRLQISISSLLLEVLELLDSQEVNLDENLSSARRGVSVFLKDLENYIEQRWTLQEMAVRCGLGKTQFANYCQEITNMSPIEYLNGLRMSRAAGLLSSTSDLPITDIAFLCGFESSQYFSSVFSRYHNCSPRQFRARQHAPAGADE